VTPEYDDVPVEGVIEKWDLKFKSSQIKAIKIPPMFGADAVRLHKEANEAHPATTVVKSQEAAENLHAVVGMDIKFMVGWDQAWVFPDDDEGPAAAGPPLVAFPPAAAVDDAPPLPAPPVDPADFTNLNVLNETTTRRALCDLGARRPSRVFSRCGGGNENHSKDRTSG
jgi:hypothetical protein